MHAMIPHFLPPGVAGFLASHPSLMLVMVAGGRYLLVSGALFILAQRQFGEPAFERQARIGRHQIIRELGYSLLTIAIIAAVNGSILIGLDLIAHSRLYTDISAYGWPWFFMSILLMLFVHDTQFYWTHRLLHTRRLFRAAHYVHHASRHPTAWAAYSFHPWEALVEVVIGVSMIFLFPVHPLAFMIFQTLSSLINAYGHCGRDAFPVRWRTHWLGRWFNTSSAHALHHRDARYNFGLYFLFWDRWMGTLHPAHDEQAAIVPKPDGTLVSPAPLIRKQA